MLKRLKRKFMIIVMTLVGLVLTGAMALTIYSSYAAQQRLIDGALTRGLDDTLSSVPTIGSANGDWGQGSSMPVLAANISADGYVLETSNQSVLVDRSAMNQIIRDALRSGSNSGFMSDRHIAWKSKANGNGTIRLVMVDTSSADYMTASQVSRGILVSLLALSVLFAIAWYLADWALAPVARAWDQQRRFVSDASHELKTPLAVIIANTEILAHEPNLSDDLKRWVHSTQEESQHMKTLVGDLLQLSRLDESMAEGATVTIPMEPLDLSDIVEENALEFDALAFERGCLIETHIEPAIHIRGNHEMVARLVRTLIDNACKYAEKGSTIHVVLASINQHPTLSVNNKGTTIDPEDLSHIFDRFYRTDKARSRQQAASGFGLGLAIAKGIADSHGATIGAQSTDADGTTFSVKF